MAAIVISFILTLNAEALAGPISVFDPNGNMVNTTATNSSLSYPPDTSTTDSPTTELTRGFIFMLVTSLALAIIYHSLCGSLIYGPTNSFRLFSPIPLLGEMLALILRLGEYFADKYDWKWFYDKSSGTSNAFTFRNAAYSIVFARMINVPWAHNRDELEQLQDSAPARRVEFFEGVVEELNKGIRFRLGIGLPIIAQFVKLAVLKGVFLPKVLGYLYFIYWILAELLIFLAIPKRKMAFGPDEAEDIATRVNELLFINKRG